MLAQEGHGGTGGVVASDDVVSVRAYVHAGVAVLTLRLVLMHVVGWGVGTDRVLRRGGSLGGAVVPTGCPTT